MACIPGTSGLTLDGDLVVNVLLENEILQGGVMELDDQIFNSLLKYTKSL